VKIKCIPFQFIKAFTFLVSISLFSLSALAGSYTLNFKDAELSEFIKFVADATGYTVIIDPQVKAKIQVLSKQPLNEKELYDLFLSVLATHGYAAVKNGNVLRILPDRTARTTSVPVASLGQRNNAEFVTQIIQLQNVSATKLIPVLRPLVPQEGHMAAYQDSNVIVISDTADNIKKIMEIISTIDKGSNQEIEIVHLENASAEELVTIVNKVLNPKAADPANTEEQISLVAESRGNNIIITGAEQARMRVKVLIQQLDRPLKNIGNANIVTLEYAKAKDLAPILAKVSQNMAKISTEQQGAKGAAAASPAMIEADEATNSLVITADSAIMDGLSVLIKQLDMPRAQVLVEAIIVEVIQGDGKDLGFDWLMANQHGGFAGSNNSGGLAGQVALGAFDDDEEDALKGIASALATVPGAVWGGADYDVNGTSFSAILTALETNGETNILSTPSLMTLDNHEASIIVGQEVPFVTGNYTSTGTSGGTTGGVSTPGNPFQTIERKNVGITLKVTPHVNKDNKITLEIVQEVSGLAASDVATADVITNERKIETTVITGDGEVIVLGGLIDDDVQETVSKVPVLGDLPLIGRLFKKSSTKVRKKNLMVFIRPTVVRDSQKSMEVSESRYRDIRNMQRYKKARGVDLFDEDVLPELPDWENQVNSVKQIQAESTAAEAQTKADAGVQPLPEEKVETTGAANISPAEVVSPPPAEPAIITPATTNTPGFEPVKE
jgi:general secretion pathway protein D